MLNTNLRRLKLSAWFFLHAPQDFFLKLKLQKFLFFYESFCFTLNYNYDFSYLKGYKKGPVFSDAYGDYTYREPLFLATIESIAETLKKATQGALCDTDINEEVAKKAAFLVSILNQEELSELTHDFDIWKNEKSRIDNNEQHVNLSHSNFSNQDKEFASDLYFLYSVEQIDNWDIIKVGKTNFLISKEEKKQLNSDLENALSELSTKQFDNPVYISVENGVIVVDS
ncbi:hypothetical protein [Enterococcus casseliflavus]|uniref:hypothetical protein n=1 Tax=Enterococcus casseliflavus TaxID=37734 RepID=UPI0022E33684|nr:hypothetical protein [Enterococcus casseliflavus]